MPNLMARTGGRAGTVTMVMRGEIDLARAAEVEGELERALADADRRLVVDLSGLSFLDSTGLAILMRLNRQARESRRELVIVKGPPHVHRVFALTGVSEVLTMVDDAPVEAG